MIQTNLHSHILKNKEICEQGYICKKCGSKDEKIKTSTLTMLPEILILVLDNYKSDHEKQDFNYPKKMMFPSGGKSLVYKFISRVQHSGGVGGGHYVADAIRNDGWYHFNDNHVAKLSSIPKSNKYTYMAFYHYEKIV